MKRKRAPKPKQILERKRKLLVPKPVHRPDKTDEEGRIRSWLRSITGREFLPDRTILGGKELDMFNHELRFAVEYCGLYWHTEDSPQPRDKWSHYHKFKKCQEYRIRLVTLFEDEWLEHQAKVQSMLKCVFGLNSRKLTAGECVTECLSLAEANSFLEKTSLQGQSSHGQYACGLRKDGELLAAMVFAPLPRFGSFRVDRIGFADDVTITGGNRAMFNRLLAAANAKEVKGWSDNRWSNGLLYSSLGFVRIGELPPDYSYVDFKKKTRIHRKIIERDMDDLTAAEAAKDKGLHKIWDCGSVQWRWTNEQ